MRAVKRRVVRALFLALASGLAATGAQANPQGGHVVAGTATITSAGKTLTVNQSSNRAIVNWQGFSIGAGETTRINLPSSVSAILNRVTSANPSLIAGSLSSNGQVYLINPNGIVVGPNGRINTAGFVASTLNVPNDAFMQGGGMTFKGDSGAGIQVLGSVTASDGDVVLIAAMVDNQGHIAAPNGQAILGSGGEVYYIPDGQSDIVIKAPANGGGSVSNSGTIAAASVQMKAAGSPYALAVNNSGLVSATGISQHAGRIVLDGGDGDVEQSGTLTAAGGSATLNGGNVNVSGTIDVSAPTGGGRIAVTASKKATIAKTATLKANATIIGNGGKITVKSAGTADVEGRIEAKGGPQGGDGGSAEISGSDLAFGGTVDMTAPQGKTGSLLLDPTDINICYVFYVSCSTTSSLIDLALLTADVTISATNSITVDALISSPLTNNLFLDAPNITLNDGISLPNAKLEFTNSSGTNTGTVSSASNETISASEVDVFGNYATVNLAGAVNAGTLRFNEPLSASTISVSNGANVIPTLSFVGGETVSGSFAFSTTGALDLNGGTLTAGAITILSAGNLSIEANTALDSSGTKTVGSVSGTFINRNVAGPFIGTGRNLIYAATDVGLDQDGLGYTQYNPVAIGSDPAHGLSSVVYIAHSTLLPTMTVTADNAVNVYGVPLSGFSASVSGGTAGDLARPVQFQVLGGGTNAGTYAIQPFGTISSTRALSFVNGTLTVNPALLTVTANDTKRLQGASAPAFSASYSGLVNGDNTNNILVFFTSQGFSTSPPGTYSIRPFGFSQNPNYTLQFVNGTLTIAPAPPPTLNPFTTLTTVTFDPGTVNPTNPTLTTTETLKPTTLTPDQVNPVTETITVNPLIGTPLQIFGPLAETELEEFASSFNPPLDLGSILIALKDPGAGPTIMVMIENFMYVELDAILNKDQKTWTADETAFVNGFLDYINAQRAAAANKAMADYEAWAKATVAAEDAKIKQDTGQTQLMEIAALSANPPVPPGDFLDEASDGMVVSSSQAESMLAQMGATGTLVSVMNGTATATEMAYLSGQTFSVLGKGWTTFNGSLEQESGQVPVKLEDVLTKNGNINNAIYRKLPANVRQELLREFNAKGGFKNPDSTGTETETSTSTSTGSDAGKGASTATNTAKETETVLKDTTTAFDVVETVGRIASVAGVVGEAAAVIIQTITTATQYAEQASYNDAFSAAVNNALKPIGVSDLKAMMSSGKAMTYLMAEMAGGNPNAIDSSNILKTTKPDMPLSQILNIEKNF